MEIQLPVISHYGGGNPNATMLTVFGITFYYSYETIVAYEDAQDGLVVSENVWTVTTGKHLTWIDGGAKDQRISYDEFQAKLQAACVRCMTVNAEKVLKGE